LAHGKRFQEKGHSGQFDPLVLTLCSWSHIQRQQNACPLYNSHSMEPSTSKYTGYWKYCHLHANRRILEGKLLNHSLPVDRTAVESVEGWDGLGVPVGHGRPACRKNSLCQRKNMFIALQENYFSDGKEHLSFDFFY